MKRNIDKLDYIKVKKKKLGKKNTVSMINRQHKLWKQGNILPVNITKGQFSQQMKISCSKKKRIEQMDTEYNQVVFVFCIPVNTWHKRSPLEDQINDFHIWTVR